MWSFLNDRWMMYIKDRVVINLKRGTKTRSWQLATDKSLLSFMADNLQKAQDKAIDLLESGALGEQLKEEYLASKNG